LYNPDGSINSAVNSTGSSTWPAGTSPIAQLLNKYTAKTSNLVSNLTLGYEFIPGLQAKLNLGYTYNQLNDLGESPLSAVAPQQRPYSINSGTYDLNNMNTWIVEPQVNFSRHIWKGNLDALAGGTITRTNTNGEQFEGLGFTSEALIPDMNAAATIYSEGTTITTYKYNAYFGRVGYGAIDGWI
jgi:hypothetical protein